MRLPQPCSISYYLALTIPHLPTTFCSSRLARSSTRRVKFLVIFTLEFQASIQSQVIVKDTSIYIAIPFQTDQHSCHHHQRPCQQHGPHTWIHILMRLRQGWKRNPKHTPDQKPFTIPVTIPDATHTSTSNTFQIMKVPYYIDRPISKPLLWW